MGSQIGTVSGTAAALRTYPDSGRGRPAVANPVEDPRPRKGDVVDIRAGFGDGTLSPSGAALRTVNSNLAAARRYVPSVEELRESARERAAERAAAVEEQTAPQNADAAAFEPPAAGESKVVSFRPDPAPQARAFAADAAPSDRTTSPPEPAAGDTPATRLDLFA